MSSWLKHIEHIPTVKSGHFKAGDSFFYNGIDSRLITPEILRVINEKAAIYHKHIKVFNNDSIDDFVGYLSGCDLYVTSRDVGGYFNQWDNIIAYNEEYTNSKIILEILCHEISHSIQVTVGIDIHAYSLLARFKSEQQCDTMAYYLMNAIKPGSITKSDFKTGYFDKGSLQWLADYYDGTVVKNDVF